MSRRLESLIRSDSPAARTEAADWAAEYIRFDDPQVYPEVEDPAVWDALGLLASADLPSTDRAFLYGPEDFAAWRAELLSAPGGGADAVAPAS